MKPNNRTNEELLLEISKLQESTQRFKAVVESCTEAIHIVDAEGKILYWNKAAEKIFGYSSDEILGKSHDVLMPAWLGRRVKELTPQLMHEGITSLHNKPVQGVGIRKDGREIPVEVAMSSWTIGDAIFFSAIIHDLSERKEIEHELLKARNELEQRIEERTAELKKTGDFLENIVRTTGEALVVTDALGYIRLFNRKAEHMFGYSAGEIIGKHFTELGTYTGETGINPPLIEKLFAVGFIENFNTNYRRKNGEIFPVEINIVLLKDGGGDMSGAVASIRDITERRLFQSKLQMLGTAIQQTIDGVAIANLEGTIQFTNMSWVQMHGYTSQEELAGRHLKMFHTQNQYEQDVVPFLDKIKKDGSHMNNVGHLKKDGSTFPTWMTCTLLKDTSDNPVALVGIARDITDLKHAQEKLLQEIEDRKQIEQKLRARDKELANKAHELEEVNSALKVLLQRTENSKKDLEEKILFNMKELVAPYIDKLKTSGLDERQNTYLNIIQSNVLNIISPFGQKLSVKYAGLTPSEMHIANLIKDGLSSKEISEIMGLSNRTVDFHRKNMRRKLGINNQKANLRSLLLSM